MFVLALICGARGLLGDTATSAFRIQELREGASEVLFCRRHAETHTFRDHFPMKLFQITDVKPEFHTPRGILLRGRVQAQRRFASREFAPAGRLEFQWQAEHVTIKSHGTVHVRYKLNYVVESHVRHLRPSKSITLPMWDSKQVDALGAVRLRRMVRLVGVEPTTGKSPADFKPAAYANFATAAPGVYAANSGYHASRKDVASRRRAVPNRASILSRLGQVTSVS